MRSSKGSMIMVSVLALAVISLTIVVGLCFYMILSQQRRGQTACDDKALMFANILNQQNRAGQMNAIVERSRELVYLSRQNASAAGALPIPGYQALANQLLLESRESAELVDKERKNQIDITLCDVHNCVTRVVKDSQVPPHPILSWLFEEQPEITTVNFGSVTDVLSSVASPRVLSDLHEYDLKAKYVEKTSNLYYGNINAKLPSPDEDLPFHFASLPAQVDKVDAPPRLVESSVFVSAASIFQKDSPLVQKPPELPSAVQVIGTATIKNGKDSEMHMRLSSSATACSALEAP